MFYVKGTDTELTAEVKVGGLRSQVEMGIQDVIHRA